MQHVSSLVLVTALFAGAEEPAPQPKERATLQGHGGSAFHLAFSPDGKLLASCGEPVVKVWDLETRRAIATFNAPEGPIWGRSVTFSADGRALAYLFDDGVVRLWNPVTRDEPVVVGTIEPGVGGLKFLPDGRLLAYSRGRGTLFNVKSHAPLATFNGPSGSFNAAALSPDGKTLVSAGEDAKVRLWDVDTQRLRAVLDGHTRIIWAVAVSPDGKVFASGSEDGVLKFWDLGTGELLATIDGPRGRFTALAFAPDGSILASTRNNNQLQFWDAATRKELFKIPVSGATVRGAAFTEDGRTMATGDVDGIVRLWDVPPRGRKRTRRGPHQEVVKGTIAHSPEDHVRITGKARVIDGNTIAFEDGVELDISAGMDAPALGQKGLRDGALYACGEEAAVFLRQLIGDRPVTCYVNTKNGKEGGRESRLRGTCLIGETRVDEAMILQGWAVSNHSLNNALELIAREQRRGLWRGKFVAPSDWRRGARLPGEPTAPPPKRTPAAATAAPVVVKEGERVSKLVGTVEVLDAHTLRFGDGSLIELNGGMDAPDLEQKAAVGDGLYSWGEQAADYLRRRIGGQAVTCYVGGLRADRFRADCYVDETELQIEMVRNGWAVSHHSGMDGWEMFAREGRRGIWRGRFVRPEDWRKGDRLPGESGETTAQREALAALAPFDPVVTHDESKPGRPVIAVRFRANSARKADDRDLARLKSFPNLRLLDIPSAPNVTDAGLKHLAGLDRLVELDVSWSAVTAKGVVALIKGRIMMDRLDVSGVPFLDDDLASLRGVPDFHTLNLRATAITDAGLAQLKRFESLRSLSLMSTAISDAGLRHLERLTELEDLDLDRTAITDAALVHLKGLCNLRRLQLAHTAVTDAGLEHLQGLPKLQSLNVRGTKVTDAALKRLRYLVR